MKVAFTLLRYCSNFHSIQSLDDLERRKFRIRGDILFSRGNGEIHLHRFHVRKFLLGIHRSASIILAGFFLPIDCNDGNYGTIAEAGDCMPDRI